MAIDRLPWSGRAFVPPPSSGDRDSITVPGVYALLASTIGIVVSIGVFVAWEFGVIRAQGELNAAAIAALHADVKALRAEMAPWPLITNHARPEM